MRKVKFVKIDLSQIKNIPFVYKIRRVYAFGEEGYEIIAKYPTNFTISCATCSGLGSIEKPVLMGGDYYSEEKRCESCGGTGIRWEADGVIELVIYTDINGVVLDWKADLVENISYTGGEEEELPFDTLEEHLKEAEIPFEVFEENVKIGG